VDPLQFFASSGLVIVAGKGGVGKTTVTAAMAIAAARLGQRVLVVEMEGASGLGPALGAEQALGSGTVVLRPTTSTTTACAACPAGWPRPA
jgi:CO dehydrogenase nickel-insertion accessory protein CooC1